MHPTIRTCVRWNQHLLYLMWLPRSHTNMGIPAQSLPSSYNQNLLPNGLGTRINDNWIPFEKKHPQMRSNTLRLRVMASVQIRDQIANEALVGLYLRWTAEAALCPIPSNTSYFQQKHTKTLSQGVLNGMARLGNKCGGLKSWDLRLIDLKLCLIQMQGQNLQSALHSSKCEMRLLLRWTNLRTAGHEASRLSLAACSLQTQKQVESVFLSYKTYYRQHGSYNVMQFMMAISNLNHDNLLMACLAGKHRVCASFVNDSKVTPTAPPKFFEEAFTEFPVGKDFWVIGCPNIQQTWCRCWRTHAHIQ